MVPPAKESENGSSHVLTPSREQPRSTRIVVAYLWPAFSATKRTIHAPTSFDRYALVSQGHTSYTNNSENCSTEVHGRGGGLEPAEPARKPTFSRPKPFTSPKNTPRILPVRRYLLALVGRKRAMTRDQLSPQTLLNSVFDSRAQGFSTPLARWRSSCPLPSQNLAFTHPIERVTVHLRVLPRPRRLSTITVPPVFRVPPAPEGTKLAPGKRRTG